MDPDPELGKFKAGSGSGINHSGSATLKNTVRISVGDQDSDTYSGALWTPDLHINSHFRNSTNLKISSGDIIFIV